VAPLPIALCSWRCVVCSSLSYVTTSIAWSWRQAQWAAVLVLVLVLVLVRVLVLVLVLVLVPVLVSHRGTNVLLCHGCRQPTHSARNYKALC
jgi:uncharacterized membrane protein